MFYINLFPPEFKHSGGFNASSAASINFSLQKAFSVTAYRMRQQLRDMQHGEVKNIAGIWFAAYSKKPEKSKLGTLINEKTGERSIKPLDMMTLEDAVEAFKDLSLGEDVIEARSYGQPQQFFLQHFLNTPPIGATGNWISNIPTTIDSEEEAHTDTGE